MFFTPINKRTLKFISLGGRMKLECDTDIFNEIFKSCTSVILNL